MLVVIRADASQSIGSGHIMRCLTLAERLRAEGAEVSFVCRDFPGNLSQYIRGKGFDVHLLPEVRTCEESSNPEVLWLGASWLADAEETVGILEKNFRTPADWLIVDHYGIDYRWESHLRPWTSKIMIVDDLANRRHDCDVLLDQNYYCNLTQRYDGMVPKDCRLLLGPRYVLLREEFYRARKEMRCRTGEICHILVFYGGADATNETEKCLVALSAYLEPQLEVDVVVGGSNPKRDRIERLCSSLPGVHYHCQVSNMAELMNKADLAFGAGGATTWERCFLGVPSIVTVTAENQRETTEAVAEMGAIWNLGWYEKVHVPELSRAAARMIKNPNQTLSLQKKTLKMVGDGDYGIRGLLEAIFQG